MIGLVQRGDGARRHVMEVFLDFHCPFSNKLFGTITQVIGAFASEVELRVIVQVQPWHWQATHMSMVVLATHLIAPDRTFDLMRELYTCQMEFSDQLCFDLSPKQVYEKLYAIAAKVGVDEAALRNQLSPDFRETVVAEMKRHVRYSRQNGIHVSPSCMINGLVNNEVSSSWSADQFVDMLKRLPKK